MIVAAAVAEYLEKKGCTHAFGIVGGANLALFAEIAKRMKMVCTAHEQAAAVAANYFYRASGRIAPCLVTAGGGSANAVTGVVEAHMDSVPLLVISGNEMSKWFAVPHSRSIGFQGFNPEESMRPFTKRTVSVKDALGAMIELDRLYREALTPRQGACWLDIPQNIASEKERSNER